MSRDFKKELQGFERVWRRVCQAKRKLPENIKLMPGRDKYGRDRRGGCRR